MLDLDVSTHEKLKSEASELSDLPIRILHYAPKSMSLEFDSDLRWSRKMNKPLDGTGCSLYCQVCLDNLWGSDVGVKFEIFHRFRQLVLTGRGLAHKSERSPGQKKSKINWWKCPIILEDPQFQFRTLEPFSTYEVHKIWMITLHLNSPWLSSPMCIMWTIVRRLLTNTETINWLVKTV